MQFTASTILLILLALIFIALILFVYLRSRQGDQRMIQTSNDLLLPLLSIVAITIGGVYGIAFHDATCSTGIPNLTRYLGVGLALILIIVGTVRYFLSVSRDRRLVIHPLLFALIIIILAFIIETLYGCL